MRKYARTRSASALIPVVVVLSGSPSTAEENPDSDPGSPRPDTPYLDEILVTATRRQSPISEIPTSVHVKSASNLRQLAAFDFHDYARSIPGLSFTDTGFGGATPVVRGIQSSTFQEVNPTTAVYLGEVPITAAPNPLTFHYPPDPGLLDLDRIEVLRGPQGTLYGASALGGAVRIFPRGPDPTDVDASLAAGVDSVADGDTGYFLGGIFNTPVSDGRGAVRGVAYSRTVGGYINNVNTGTDDINNRATVGMRIAGLYKLSEQWSISGLAMLQDTEWDGNGIENIPLQPRTQDQLRLPGADELRLYEFRVDAEFAWGTLRSVTSWYERDSDVRADIRAFVDQVLTVSTDLDPIPENSTVVFNQTDTSQFVQELRLVSHVNGRLRWVAGGFYQDLDLQPDQDFPSPGFDAATGGLAAAAGFPDNLTVFRGDYTLEHFALYGEGSYAISGALDLSAGIRQFWIDRRETSTGAGWLFPTDPVDVSANESGVAPSISLAYRPGDNLRLYARAAEGFRPGGTNPQSFFDNDVCRDELADLGLVEAPASYTADSLWSYELGMHVAWSGGRYRFSGSVYHLDWSDIQSFKFLPQCGNAYIENAGEATADGTELELTAQPNVDLTLSAGLTLLRARLAEDAPNFGASDGDRIPGVPEFAATLSAQWRWGRFGRWESTLHGVYSYVGNSFTEFSPSFAEEVPSYSMTRLGIGMESDSWSIDLFVNNLFDERGVTNIQAALGEPWVMTSRPRTLGLVVKWRL